MIKNYILIAFRTLKKQGIFAVINILGLSIGQSAAFLIVLFIVDEYNTNDWVRNVERQYLLESDWKEGINRPGMTTLAPLGKALTEDYPNLVANYFSIDGVSCNISDGESKSFRMNLQLGNDSMLEMFGIPLLHGDEATALQNPSGIIIQKEVAIKFFGRADVIGKSLMLETQNAIYHPLGKKEYIITGVIDDLPINSITDNLGARNDVYINSDNILFFRPYNMFEDWETYIIQTRLELQPGVKPEELTEPIAQLIKANASQLLGEEIIPKLTPLATYNLTDNNHAKQRLIFILSLVALFILVMAMINFVNISLGLARRRLREIGVRKAMGGMKWQLKLQFLSESVLLSLCSLFLTLCFVQLALPSFMSVVGKNNLSNINTFEVSAYFTFMAVIIGLLAGAYPAFILSRHTAVKALKGKILFTPKKVDIKNVMLTIQYVLTLFVIVSTIIVSKQIDFITNKEKGYNADNVLVISSVPRWYSPDGVERMLGITKEFQNIPGVRAVSLSYEIPDGRHGTMAPLRDPDTQQYHYFGEITADEEYLDTYQLEVLEGKYFQETDRDRNRIILNETASKTLFKDKPAIGEWVSINDSTRREVIGIVKDFHFSSAKRPIEGIAFSQMDSTKIFRYLSIKLNSEARQETAAAIENKWKEVFPLVPFEHFYMEDKLNTLYASDNNFRKALIIASVFALSIVLIGVFSLTVQNLAFRIKEIGIRRVLGASSVSIWKILTKEQLFLFIVAIVIALPITYLGIDYWLSDFTYRIEQPILIYILSSSLIFSMAILIVSSELWKTIKINPVDSLKHE